MEDRSDLQKTPIPSSDCPVTQLQTSRPVHGRRDSRLRRDVETARPRCGDPQQLRRQLGRAVVLSLHPRAGSSSVLHAGFTDMFTAITTF
jgi:hypothetical protein